MAAFVRSRWQPWFDALRAWSEEMVNKGGRWMPPELLWLMVEFARSQHCLLQRSVCADFDKALAPSAIGRPSCVDSFSEYFISAHTVGEDSGPWSFSVQRSSKEESKRCAIGIGIAWNPKQPNKEEGNHTYAWNHISWRFPKQQIYVYSCFAYVRETDLPAPLFPDCDWVGLTEQIQTLVVSVDLKSRQMYFVNRSCSPPKEYLVPLSNHLSRALALENARPFVQIFGPFETVSFL